MGRHEKQESPKVSTEIKEVLEVMNRQELVDVIRYTNRLIMDMNLKEVVPDATLDDGEEDGED